MSAEQEERGIVRRSLERLAGLAVLIVSTALKWGFLFAKFFAFFISFAAYTIWFGSWKFALGFVLLILVHELGHAAEARRQGLHVSVPTFIPFFGAFVTIRHSGLPPLRSALVALAGPVAGGVGTAIVWAVGSARNLEWLVVLANLGFLLNAFNLLPIGFLDGGSTLRAFSQAWREPRIRYVDGVPVEVHAPDRNRALLIAGLYALVAAGLLLGLLATRRNGAL